MIRDSSPPSVEGNIALVSPLPPRYKSPRRSTADSLWRACARMQIIRNFSSKQLRAGYLVAIALAASWSATAIAQESAPSLFTPLYPNAEETIESPSDAVASELPWEASSTTSVQPATYEAASAYDASLADRLKAVEAELKKIREAEAKKKEDAAKKPTMIIGGQLQADAVWFGQDQANMATVGDLEDGWAFRRARIVSRGEAFDVVEYQCGFDFALSGRPSFLDVWVGLKDLPHLDSLRVGHFFEPFSLERLTQNRYNTFLERSVADSFAPARNLGLMGSRAILEDHMTLAAGVFRTDSDVNGDDTGDDGEQAVTGRVSWLPHYDEASGGASYVHFGLAYSYRDTDEGRAQFQARPEISLTAQGEGTVPSFVNTGAIPAEHYQLFGMEFAWIQGPFSVQSEVMLVPVDRTLGDDVTFEAAYIYGSYFLTGEHRPYIRKLGFMDRVMPFENFFHVKTEDGSVETGSGAWEVAARLSYIDLDDDNIAGGQLTDFTIGLNWYLNPYTRVKWEYIHAHLDRNSVESNAQIAGMRFDIDF